MKNTLARFSNSFLAIAALTMLSPTAQAQVIANPSLTGPVASGTAPIDWFAWQNTPDTVDAGGPFNNTGVPWTLSPDGGTFVRGGGSSLFPSSEAIGQNITGFTIGDTYQVFFFQTNLGFEHPPTGNWLGEDGYWELVVNGTPTDTSTVLTKPTVATDPIVWSTDTMTFVAPSTTVELAFVSRSSAALAAYMGIDGIHFVPVSPSVPEPSTALLAMGASLGLLAISRRNRN